MDDLKEKVQEDNRNWIMHTKYFIVLLGIAKMEE